MDFVEFCTQAIKEWRWSQTHGTFWKMDMHKDMKQVSTAFKQFVKYRLWSVTTMQFSWSLMRKRKSSVYFKNKRGNAKVKKDIIGI